MPLCHEGKERKKTSPNPLFSMVVLVIWVGLYTTSTTIEKINPNDNPSSPIQPGYNNPKPLGSFHRQCLCVWLQGVACFSGKQEAENGFPFRRLVLPSSPGEVTLAEAQSARLESTECGLRLLSVAAQFVSGNPQLICLTLSPVCYTPHSLSWLLHRNEYFSRLCISRD